MFIAVECEAEWDFPLLEMWSCPAEFSTPIEGRGDFRMLSPEGKRFGGFFFWGGR